MIYCVILIATAAVIGLPWLIRKWGKKNIIRTFEECLRIIQVTLFCRLSRKFKAAGMLFPDALAAQGHELP
jgi:hypothetical protein